MFRRSVAFLDGKLFDFSDFLPDCFATMRKCRGTACDTFEWMFVDIMQQWFAHHVSEWASCTESMGAPAPFNVSY